MAAIREHIDNGTTADWQVRVKIRATFDDETSLSVAGRRTTPRVIFWKTIKMRHFFLLLLLAAPFSALPPRIADAQEFARIQHTYEVKFRLKSIVSTTQVQANDAAQAKKLVEAQYGKEVTVLSTKRLK